jgi:aspartyl-tRNA(Asn)/glutamyl-tRNA(Gln) amidotransferase subunit A
MGDVDVARLSVAELVGAYRDRSLSPVEVTQTFLDRIEEFDSELNAYLEVTADLALQQAATAERAYADGAGVGPLAGIPVSIKDAFHIEGVVTTLGSLVHRDQVAKNDSGVVRRLRVAGAVFLGKTNTAEFGQSATTDNLLGPDTGNPWDPTRTPGGSSGGAAASVAGGLATIAVGSDGGGSIRIPAAFTGTFGLKPSPGVVADEKGFRAMTDFVSAGPMTTTVADSRELLSVLSGRTAQRAEVPRGLRIAYCPRPEGRPVESGVALAVERAAEAFSGLGHQVSSVDLPVGGWNDVFGPLVLDDEHRERGHLLLDSADKLTRYERSSLRAALALDPADVQRALDLLPTYRRRIDALFDGYDVLLTPVTAVPAFPLGERPTSIAGEEVDPLWGAFPFAVPFNVAGVAAASLPCGFSGGLPVGAQLITRAGTEQFLLDVCEQLEDALEFDRAAVNERWTSRTGVS